jgi:hypothetical protein
MSIDPKWPDGFRVFTVTDFVIEQARRMGATQGARTAIAYYARYGVPFTHPLGNWRHEGLLMRIKGNLILSIALLPNGDEGGYNQIRGRGRR